MDLRIFDTADHAAMAAAQWLTAQLADAVKNRGKASLALSGGRTPWRMLEAMNWVEIPCAQLSIYQVDERAVPVDDERRNGRRIAELLGQQDVALVERFCAMSAEREDLESAAGDYARVLSTGLGSPPILDVVQLGLGADAHTASLIPGDPLLDVIDRSVGVAATYQGTRRLSLTFPVLNAARARLWLVTGSDKVDALASLVGRDTTLPCGRVKQDGAVVFADAAAAARVRV
jgi:6-phosphogluconolactonase